MTGKIIHDIARPPAEQIDHLREVPPAVASDAMDRLQAMEGDIDPLGENVTLCGTAVTVDCKVGDNIMAHKALEIANEGDVVVIDAKGHLDTAVWGELMTVAAEQRGLEGVVIDGAIRDVSENRTSDLPIYCKGGVPLGPHKGWGGRINHSIQCGGVSVSPGDVLLGDDDGIVVVPAAEIESVVEEAEHRQQRETEWRARIEAGETTMDAIGLKEQYRLLQIEDRDST
jgi:4-hydroxy-4-methyl-2-oxoglutarate aldolase